MAANQPNRSQSSPEDSSSSSSSSDSSGSSPTTPPSPALAVPLPPTPPPQRPLPETPVTPPERRIIRSPNRNGRHSANGQGKSPKSSTPKSRLGVIDEDSAAVSPDIPLRSPKRLLGLSPLKFTFQSIPTLYATRKPHTNPYDDVEGPRGEKFTDVRNNSKIEKPKRSERKKTIYFGIIVLVVIAALLIGLLVGLMHKSSNTKNQSNGTNSSFPAGQWSITTYLDEINTSCTSNAATWRCYPYQTYNQSTTASQSTLNWIISSSSSSSSSTSSSHNDNNNKYTISSADSLFSYTFQSVPLTKTNNGTADEYWGFNTTFDKSVIPSSSITTDGSAARCFFNGTLLTARLYTNRTKDQALNTSTGSTNTNSNSFQPWPYALDFYEEKGDGVNVPNCYEVVNGTLGERIDITSVSGSGAAGSADCECLYANYLPV